MSFKKRSPMVLIISENNDYSTSKVIKWLRHYQQAFLRLNGITSAALSSLQLNADQTGTLTLDDNKALHLQDITALWYRRGDLRITTKEKAPLAAEQSLQAYLERVKADELATAEAYVYHLLSSKKSIGSFSQGGVNKLQALHKAKQAGLSIPDTLLTGDKQALVAFFQKHQQIIVKPVFEIPVYSNDTQRVKIFTSLVSAEIIDRLEAQFFPSLFQECIDKKYELRVFYLNGVCYSNAIFSQNREQTQIDSRQYAPNQVNRRVPYSLPAAIQEKLRTFMQTMELNCGSIDLIIKPDNEYIFLEVNPVGKFGMTSYLGNYQLEKKIAKYLSDV